MQVAVPFLTLWNGGIHGFELVSPRDGTIKRLDV